MKETKAAMKRYDLPGWEGGIAVFVTNGDHGTKIVSIPRLGLSTCLINDNEICKMLMKNKTMYNNPEESDTFGQMILRDIQTCN